MRTMRLCVIGYLLALSLVGACNSCRCSTIKVASIKNETGYDMYCHVVNYGGAKHDDRFIIAANATTVFDDLLIPWQVGPPLKGISIGRTDVRAYRRTGAYLVVQLEDNVGATQWNGVVQVWKLGAHEHADELIDTIPLSVLDKIKFARDHVYRVDLTIDSSDKGIRVRVLE